MRNLRLTLITAFFPPSVGGASEDFRLLVKAWERSPSLEQIAILTERRTGSPACEAEGKAIVRRLIPVTHRVKRRVTPFYIANRVWMYALLVTMSVWYLRRWKSRVVLVHGRYGRKAFLKALKLIGAKVVVFLSDHFSPPGSLAGCDALICATENVHERAKLELSGSCQIHYVPLPFDPPKTRSRTVPEAEANTPYFLFLGEVSHWKGVDVLLEAFASFRQQHPEYRLLLAGPVCDVHLLTRDGQDATFLGEVDHEMALGLIERAEALVLPSRSEGLPRVCLEAIALGTKVICPPGIPELQRACPEWILPDITSRSVLEKLKQAVTLPFCSSFKFEEYDPDLAGNRILAICNDVSLQDK